MELIQASFQASFDARVERLSAVDLSDLRTIFRFFDTDSDGAVSSDQACRMFALLGLDVNPAHVQDLEEVYLNEFIKIVDSHVSAPAAVESAAPEDVNNTDQQYPLASLAVAPLVPVLQIAGLSAKQAEQSTGIAALAGTATTSTNNDSGDSDAPLVLDEDALRQRNEQCWDDEWKLIDTYRRGRVDINELRLFLASCASTIPTRDLQRFMEMFGEPLAVTATSAANVAFAANAFGEDARGDSNNQDSDDDVFELTKAGYFKFRRDYTEQDAPDSDLGLSSNDDSGSDNDELGNAIVQEHTARGGVDPSGDNSESVDKQQTVGRRACQLQSNEGASSSRSHSSRRSSSNIVVEPGVLDQLGVDEFADDDDDDAEDIDGDHGSMDHLTTHSSNDVMMYADVEM